jgi:ribosome-associated translation inhibitor RaiA
MQFDIQSLNFPNTAALASHTRRRLGFGLTRHADRIARVVVRLGDENGPRGGPDKFCRLQVNLVDAPQVVIRDCGPDLYAVIDRASDRAARAVAKQLERNRFGRQRPGLSSALQLPAEGLVPPAAQHEPSAMGR